MVATNQSKPYQEQRFQIVRAPEIFFIYMKDFITPITEIPSENKIIEKLDQKMVVTVYKCQNNELCISKITNNLLSKAE